MEAEKAEREQDEDDKRKSTEWNFIPDNTTEQYLEYKKTKTTARRAFKNNTCSAKTLLQKKGKQLTLTP